MLNRLRQFGFTKQDLIIIAFLLTALIAGVIIKLSGWNAVTTYDYSSADKNFIQHTDSAFTKLDNKPLTKEQEEKLSSIKKFSDSLYSEKDNSPSDKSDLLTGKKININNALAGDLTALPGIGEAIAERIIEYRGQIKSFKRTEDIMNVKGIGEKKYEKIKEYITVE